MAILIRVKNYMRNAFSYSVIRTASDLLFFLCFFLYFFFFKRYHLAFQEQIQLFRFNADYFREFLSRPGGLSEYAGAFLTQFFNYPFAAAFIITLLCAAIFLIFIRIFSVHNIKGQFWSYIPLIMIAALHSNYLYSAAFTVAFLLSLIYFALYLQAGERKIHLFLILVTWPMLDIAAGGFSLMTGIMCIIHAALVRKDKLRWPVAVTVTALTVIIPLIFSVSVFHVADGRIYTTFLPVQTGSFKEIFLILTCYTPSVLLLSALFRPGERSISSRLKHSLNAAALIIVVAFSVFVFRSFRDENTELLLGIDSDVQRSDWEAVLIKSGEINEPNRMVLHYTNLALYKTGHLCDRLFHYPQSGKAGLWLDWQQDWLIAFFGCGTYYQIGYNSEAYRWAFEAMVAKGPNPRSLKILALTCIAENDLRLAEKYLNILRQTASYRRWAERYLSILDDPDFLDKDKELSAKRDLMIRSVFINSNNLGGRLQHLLREHPDNRMAYEYFMASLLLEKDLDGFAANIERVKDLGYKSLPVHFEEAILAYRSYSGKNILPAGYIIGPQTMNRLEAYAAAVYSYGTDNRTAAQKMYSKFGRTYWYYLKYTDHQKPLF